MRAWRAGQRKSCRAPSSGVFLLENDDEGCLGLLDGLLRASRRRSQRFQKRKTDVSPFWQSLSCEDHPITDDI